MFTSRKIQKQLIFINICPGSNWSMSMHQHVLIRLRTKKAGPSCLVAGFCHASVPPYMHSTWCQAESAEVNSHCSATSAQWSISWCWHAPNKWSGCGCVISLLPITIQKISAQISLSKMMIRTTMNKAANNQMQNVEYRKTTLISSERECEWLHLGKQADQLAFYYRWTRVITPLSQPRSVPLCWLLCSFDSFESRNQQENPDQDSTDTSVSIFYT